MKYKHVNVGQLREIEIFIPSSAMVGSWGGHEKNNKLDNQSYNLKPKWKPGYGGGGQGGIKKATVNERWAFDPFSSPSLEILLNIKKKKNSHLLKKTKSLKKQKKKSV